MVVDSASADQIAHLDAATTFDPASHEYTVLLLNRDTANEQRVPLLFRENAPNRVISFDTLTGRALKATNTFASPGVIKPAALEASKPGATIVVRVPAQSYSMLRLRA